MTDSRSLGRQAEQVAGNGLLHRRVFLANSAALAGAAGLGFMTARPGSAQTSLDAATQTPLEVPEWMTVPGAPMSGHGSRSPHEAHVQRSFISRPGAVGSGASRTPLEHLEGIITPSGLHFERHHNGIPAIDPARHRLVIHGLVARPLMFDLESLSRYPLVSRIQFLECSGNGRANDAPEPPQVPLSELHGLVSCSDWTGVPLSMLLDEAGIEPEARWIVAEGADAAAMNRSVPIAKALDDAMIALYQNGERLRPDNGYPMRLFLPGYEGNMSIKWLRRIEATAEPMMTREETSKYTDLLPDGRALQFTFRMGVKSVITSPSGGLEMQGPGLYRISGIAWTGAGRIRRVEVSADGGQSWAEAALTDPVLPLSLTRFRMPWRWNGGPAVLQSRAIDETGAVQPTRAALHARLGTQFNYHHNAIQSWRVAGDGTVSNVYA